MLTNTFSYKKPLSHKPIPEQAHRVCRLMTLALIYDDKVKKCQTNCSVLRTLAILPNIRISRSLRFPFMLISGRVIKPCTHSCASPSCLQAYDPGIRILKLKNARRIAPYSVLSQFCPIFAYREACASLLCSYRGGSLSHAPTPEQAHRGCRLMTLAS